MTKRFGIEVGALLAVCLLAGCGGTDGEAASEATGSFPSGLDPSRMVKAENVTHPVDFEQTPDDGMGRPISPEVFAQIKEEQLANAVEKLDRSKVLKAPVAFQADFSDGVAYSGTVLTTIQNHICYLSGQGGKIRSGGAGGDPRFYVGADSFFNGSNIVAYKQAQSYADVRCVPRSFFNINSVQLDYNYTFTWDQCGAWQVNSGHNGNVVEMLAGIGYDYADGADNFGIIQGNSISQANQLRVEQRVSKCRGVGYTAPFLINNANNTPKFEGPNGVGTASAAGEYSYTTQSTLNQPLTHGLTTVKASDSECYFTYLGGTFTNNNEFAKLRISEGGWWLSLSSNLGGVRAKVRCLRHVQ